MPPEQQPAARTLLEHLIRTERGETYEEFTEFAEGFARRNHLPGTLSLRHLLRLASGRRPDGGPLGKPRPATATLLERIFGVPVADLLRPPRPETEDHTALELRQRLNAARHVDMAVIALLRQQLDALRRLDRQMGAIVAYDEVCTKIEQVHQLHAYSLNPAVRKATAGLLAELNALAGWEALDRYELARAWQHHEQAKQAANAAESLNLYAHAMAQQSSILTDLGEASTAVDQLDAARKMIKRTAPAILRAWLSAAHGEGLANIKDRSGALQAFDHAESLGSTAAPDPDLPFLFLNGTHLTRWRGHALSRVDDREAFGVLTIALRGLDPSFARAETTLRIDLSQALRLHGHHDESIRQLERAAHLARDIGSSRQSARAQHLLRRGVPDDR
jgi:tetratricopeptide (TPR) repeat protein